MIRASGPLRKKFISYNEGGDIMWYTTYVMGGQLVRKEFETMQQACSHAIRVSKWAVVASVYSQKGRMEYTYMRGSRI